MCAHVRSGGKASRRSPWLLHLRPALQQEPRPAPEDLGVGPIFSIRTLLDMGS